MTRLSVRQEGFFLMIAVLLLILLGGVAFVGTRVYNREKSDEKARQEAKCAQERLRPYNGLSAECQ
jgi:hypothetical protein